MRERADDAVAEAFSGTAPWRDQQAAHSEGHHDLKAILLGRRAQRTPCALYFPGQLKGVSAVTEPALTASRERYRRNFVNFSTLRASGVARSGSEAAREPGVRLAYPI